MLALLGLLGAMVAGLTADMVLSKSPEEEIDDSADTEPTGEDGDAHAADNGDLLDFDGVHANQEQGDPPISTDELPAPEDLLLSGGSGADNLFGQGGHDTVAGQRGDDFIGGRGGDDLLDAGAGDDHAWGGTGDDTVYGGAGRDVIEGEDGDDKIDGGTGDDALAGHEGRDLIAGGEGMDTVLGGAGDDTLAGGGADDWLAGGFGNDVLRGDAGSDTLDGNDGDDVIWGIGAEGDGGTDFLNGGAGDDRLMIGAKDYAHGGEGADTFALDDWISGGDIAHISDYTPGEDQIFVVYDPASHPDPALTLVGTPGSADATVMLDGLPVAYIAGGAGMDLSAIRLVSADQLAA